MLDPVWNKPVFESDRALDPLGANRVTDRMLNDLLSGITTVTPRARYYAFYLWAVNHANSGGKVKSLSQIKKNFYDLERLFMLSCVSHEYNKGNGNHKDVNGSYTGRKVWNESSENISLDFRYFGNSLGGYGQYYQGSLSRLGLVTMTDEDIFERPSPLGGPIVDAFETSVRKTDFLKFMNTRKVSKDELLQIGKELCLCSLKENNTKERDLLQNLFFGFSAERNDPKTRLRRESLFLITLLSKKLSLKGIRITDQNFLDLCYFEQVSTSGTTHSVSIPNSLIDVKNHWKLFRAHDYLAFTSEVLLSCFLRFINQKPYRGATKDEFLSQISDSALTKQFISLSHVQISSENVFDLPFSKVVDSLSVVLGIPSFTSKPFQNSKTFDARVNISSAMNEFKIAGILEESVNGQMNETTVYASWPILLILLYMRFLWMQEKGDNLWKWLVSNTASDLSPARFINTVYSENRKANFTLGDFVHWFSDEYVINQAFRIYQEKSTSINSKPKSWFHKEGEYFKRDRDYTAKHRNNRFESTITILEDLGLLRNLPNVIELTPDGNLILGKMGGVVDVT